MATYLIAPGAWLSGLVPAGSALSPSNPPKGASNGSANSPFDPPRAALLASLLGVGLQPSNPPVPSSPNAGLQPSNPPVPSSPSAGFQPSNPPRSIGSGDTIPWPWEGVDPPWVYGSRSALLSQALRRSRAKIVRLADAKQTPEPSEPAGVRPAGTAPPTPAKAPAPPHAIWRWEAPFRQMTVVSQLLSYVRVHGAASGGAELWGLTLPAGSGRQSPGALGSTRLVEIQPAKDPKLLTEQVDKVLRAAVEREDRLPEILSQMSDTWPFFESIAGVSLQAAPRTGELLNVAFDWALHLTMVVKHEIAARRPVQSSALVMPVIATPGHGSLPSGHATIAALTSELLVALLGVAGAARDDQFDRLARRIAFNRVVAGVHFPIDSLIGYRWGTQLARLLIAMAGRRQAPEALDSADMYQGFGELLEIGQREQVPDAKRYQMPVVETLAEMWTKASEELAELRV